MTPDLINGSFEFIAGIMNWINVRRIYKDKEVKGYSPWVFGFMTAWGVWNLYYYPYLEQWVSFWGGICIMISNTAWLTLAIYYHYQSKRRIKFWTKGDHHE